MVPRRRSLTRRGFLAVTAAFATLPLRAGAGEGAAPRRSRIAYFRNGEIHVGFPGGGEGKPLTKGHMDFKPSWSQTQDLLVGFRRLVDDPDTMKWKTAIFIMGADGSGFHTLSDGTHTDFNPTWTRDGNNIAIWNRRNPATGGYLIMRSKPGARPGDEVALTDPRHHTWAHSCLGDGRILVNAAHPQHGPGVFLLSTTRGGVPCFEPVACELSKHGQIHRASISPGEKRICFEFLPGTKFVEAGHTLYHAEFDARERAITNLRPFANSPATPRWFAYPRWIDGGDAIVFHSGETGRNQLYVHRPADGTTSRVSTDPAADYRYPHGEAAPC